MGTVEGYPEISQVLKQLEKCGPKKVVIAPLMIVAGDHAKNDMAGDEPDSWRTIISQKGYEVQTVLKGLGEYESIPPYFRGTRKSCEIILKSFRDKQTQKIA